MTRNIVRLCVFFLFGVLLFGSDVLASPCSKNNLNGGASIGEKGFKSDCSNSSYEREKSSSEKIVDSVTERQKINQQISSLELELGLLRAKKGSIAEPEYQTKMRELTGKLSALKKAPFIK